MAFASHDIEEFATYLGENWGLLIGAARKLAGSVIDPDDLLAEALLSTFQKWRADNGGIEHLNAYIIRSMRNRVTDELKSPRSKVEYLDGEDDLVADEPSAVPRINLYAEITLLREAMSFLPDDQRRVLHALYFEGENVGRLTEPFQRSRAAVSQLLRRAKVNLKRTMLKILLERSASTAACRRAANHLPERIDETLPSTGVIGRHLHRCSICRRTWGQFTTYSAFAFIGALVTCSNVLGSFAQPAAAAALATSASERSEPETKQTRRSHWRTLAAGTLVATGLASSAYLLWAGPQQFTETGIHFDVSAVPGPSRSVAYDVKFDSEVQGWEIESLEIKAQARVESIEAPAGWFCETGQGNVRCFTDRAAPVNSTFLVTYAEEMPSYELQLVARTPAGSTTVGTATNRNWQGDE